MLSLIALSFLTGSETSAQECLPGGSEGVVNVNGGAVRLAINDALTGEVLWNTTITETGRCADFVVDTNEGTTTSYFGSGRLFLPRRFYVLSFNPVAGYPTVPQTFRIAWDGGGYFSQGQAPAPQFYNPVPTSGNIDTSFTLSNGQILIKSDDVSSASGSQSYVNDTLGDVFTLPYDLYGSCKSSCGSLYEGLGQFISTGVSVRSNGSLIPDFRFSSYVLIPSFLRSQTWNVPGLVVRASELNVAGTLAITGATLTRRGTTPWSGVNVVDGGRLTLGAGSVVNGVQGSVSHPAAVVVSAGGRLTMNGGAVQNTAGPISPGFPCDALGCGGGLYATGQKAVIALDGTSQVFDNPAGPGVRIDSGGLLTVDSDSVEIYRNAVGIAVSGTGSSALVHGGYIRNNSGPGLRATSGARIDVLRPLVGGGGTGSLVSPPALSVRLFRNTGGLYATGTGKQPGGVISSEQAFNCVQEPCPTQPVGQHDFRLNNGTTTDAVYDAAADAGAQVLATHNYWGTDQRPLIQTSADASSLVSIDPILLAPPSAGPGGGPAARGAGPGPAGVRATASLSGARVSPGVQALLAAADGLLQSSDSTLVGERIVRAYGLATSDDDRLAVSEAAGRALAAVRLPDLMGWAVETAAVAGPNRPWGRRALALGLAGQRRYAEAFAVAQALAGETGTSAVAESHRARGLGLLVRFAVVAHDSDAAWNALADLAAVDTDGAAEIALSVAVAFPDTTAMARGLSRGADLSTPSETAQRAAGTIGDASGPSMWAGPNPTSGAVRVALTVAETSRATVAVFDVLGREVVVLHDGAADAGVLALAFDTVQLPPGLYVVRAVVHAGGGGAAVLTRTVVVSR